MAKYYFTFGCGHPTYSDKVATVTVEGESGPDTFEKARSLFMERFGSSWSMMRSEKEFSEFIAKYPHYDVVDYEELVPVECDLF